MSRRWLLAAAFLAAAVVSGCGPKSNLPKDMVPVYPVTGEVLIDGQPAKNLTAFAYKSENVPNLNATPNSVIGTIGYAGQGYVDEEGKLQFTTYTAGDGLPEGSYNICFYWLGEVFDLSISGDDERKLSPEAVKFNKRYGNPSKSDYKVTVGPDEEGDLGTIDLSTK